MSPIPDPASRENLLLGLVTGGDAKAFMELYDEHAGLVYSVSLRILADPEEARDITQTVFMTLYHKSSAYNPGYGRLAAWLAVVARNHSLSRLRRIKLQSRWAQNMYEEALCGIGVHAQIPLPAMDSSEVLLLREALDELPDVQRQAVELAFFGSLTHEQIAETLAEPLGTVKARIRRGLLRLRGKCSRLGIVRAGMPWDAAGLPLQARA